MLISLSYDKPIDETDVSTLYTPSRFSIDKDYDVPVRSNKNIDGSWIYAITSFFESYYQKQGRSINAMGINSYLKFDSNAIYNATLEFCNQHPDSSFCSLISNVDIPSFVFFEMMKSDSKLYKSLIPSLLCNSDSNCDYPALMNSNSIMFEIKKRSFSSSVSGIKKLLSFTRRPLLLTIPQVQANYYLPCSDDRVADRSECENLNIPCPNEFVEKNCTFISTQTLLPSGSFFVPYKPAIPYIKPDSILNVVLEGYNDDAIPVEGINRFSSHHLPKGGFIVRGFFSPNVGPTISYLEGSFDIFNSSEICINSFHPSNWIACNTSNPITCQRTQLECIDPSSKFCDPTRQYMLAATSDSDEKEPAVSEDKYGLTSTMLYQVQPLTPVIIDTIPFWSFSEIFEPVYFESNNPACGHWLIPYEYIELANSLAPGSVIASDIPIKFSTESYISGPQYSQNVIMSTKRHQ